MSKKIFWNYFLYKEAMRLIKKNNINLNNMSKEERKNTIEMIMEDLDDKYSEEI